MLLSERLRTHSNHLEHILNASFADIHLQAC